MAERKDKPFQYSEIGNGLRTPEVDIPLLIQTGTFYRGYKGSIVFSNNLHG